MPSILLVARQYYYSDCPRKDDGFIDEDSCYVPFWNTKTGVIVKWSLFLAILVFCGLYLLIGSIHAKKRVQKGLPPLGYHRFLVPRTTLARVDPRYRWPQASIRPYGGGVGPDGQQAYGMYSMPPPPVYDPNAPRPPMYEPPADSTKFDYSQQPPPGQPPSSQPGAAAASGPVNFGQHVEYAPPVGPPPPPAAAAAAAAAQQPPQDMYAPPPGPPPSAARSAGETIQPQGTGSANPFRS